MMRKKLYSIIITLIFVGALFNVQTLQAETIEEKVLIVALPKPESYAHIGFSPFVWWYTDTLSKRV